MQLYRTIWHILPERQWSLLQLLRRHRRILQGERPFSSLPRQLGRRWNHRRKSRLDRMEQLHIRDLRMCALGLRAIILRLRAGINSNHAPSCRIPHHHRRAKFHQRVRCQRHLWESLKQHESKRRPIHSCKHRSTDDPRVPCRFLQWDGLRTR